jgi:sulfoxide reductase heme-binding subunit YedZ
MSWTWVLIRSTGITAWFTLTAVVVWGLVAAARRSGGAPAPRAAALHRRLVAVALSLLLAHMGLLLIDTYEPFTVVQILVPFTASWRTLAVALGTIAFWLILPVWLVVRLRGRSRRWFPAAHLCAYAAWPLATGHYVLAGTDALTAWSLAILIGGTAAVVIALLLRARTSARAGSRAGSRVASRVG